MSGKTSIVDSVFVLEPYLWWKRNKDIVNINPYWIYRSMERKVSHKIAKWTAYMLFVEHRVLIDVPTLLQWPNKKKDLSPELIALVESYDGFFDDLLERIIIIDGSTNPTGIYNDCVKFIEKRGHYEQIDQYNKQFIYDNPNDVIFHITDHIGLISREKDLITDKQILDRHSSYMVSLRDNYGVTVLDIVQLNRNIEDVYRLNTTDIDVKPSDFAGSSDMYQNCDVAIGLINPYKLKVFDYGGYDINKFVTEGGENRYRGLKILKNSFGADDLIMSIFFYGENGCTIQLPSSNKINYNKLEKREYTEEFLDWRYRYPTKE